MHVVSNSELWSRFMPHGQCYAWRPEILWLHVASDTTIALAYFSIPVVLLLVLRREPLIHSRHVTTMFSLFILACGATHLMSVWTVWNGHYAMQGVLKAATALISIATAVTLTIAAPRLLSLRTSREFAVVNRELKREIAGHQQTSDQLQRVELQFRELLEQAPDGMLLATSDGTIEFANSMASSIFGYENRALCGRPVETLVPVHLAHQHELNRESFFAAPRVRSMGSGLELAGLCKDGSEVPVEISLSSFESGGRSLVLAMIRDISARKVAEERTRQQLIDLAHASRLSTVDELASGLAHELNQPLTALSHNCDTALTILQEHDQPDGDLVDIMQENYEFAHRAGGIIRALRKLVRKDRGGAELTDLNALISASVRLISPEARAASVEVRLELADRLPLVVLDEVQLQQVLVNLERNSLEVLRDVNDRPRTLVVSSRQGDENTVVVSVTDNGPGIDPDLVGNLFEPYETTRDDGMGLGLAISRSIVEAHGGQLRFESVEPSGANFRFTLPTTSVST